MIIFQRLESLAILVILLYVYYLTDFTLATLLIFFMVPDISMLGYLKGPKVGAYIYNIAHSYFFPIVIFAVGEILSSELGVAISLIWTIHIAADRTLGLGLKLPTGFKDTHLGKVGK